MIFFPRLRAIKVASSFADEVGGGRVWYWFDRYSGRVFLAKNRWSPLDFFEVKRFDDVDELLRHLHVIDEDPRGPDVVWASPGFMIDARKAAES